MELNPYPLTSAYQVKLDWLEISCLKNKYSLFRLSDLRGILEDTEGFYDEDIGLEDSKIESEIQLLLEAYETRKKHLSESYPFLLNEDGSIFSLCEDDVGALDADQQVYLYCLFFSHINSRLVLRDKVEINHPQDRDLLQISSTIAMAGYVGGNSISFGFPRPKGDNFYNALDRALSAIGEARIKPFEELNTHLQKGHIKDGGVDVISWRNNNDSYPGGRYIYFSQVASGADWEGKPVKQDIEHILKFWLQNTMSSKILDAICIPFDIEGDEQSIRDHMEILSDRLGDIFHRIRLPLEFKKGLQLSLSTPALLIERTEDINLINQFVDKFTLALRA